MEGRALTSLALDESVQVTRAYEAQLTLGFSPDGRAGKERLDRIAPVLPLAYSAGAPLLCAAVRANAGPAAKLTPGAFYALDPVEAAWWFGLMKRPSGKRARRALRILVEGVR